jgi:polysaccharide export outer membrane protein
MDQASFHYNVKIPRLFEIKLLRSVVAGSIALLMAACSSTPAPQPPKSPTDGLPGDPILGTADPRTRCTIPALLDLWARRSDSPHEDYAIGPGDEITISVPEIEELQNQHVRVSQQGTISLPLIGTVEVGGLDENQAREAVSRRLAEYMKEPRLELYVEHYRSRGVAVAGAVQRPAIYDLASFGDSLNDLLAMAGGLAPSAAQQAIFLPVGFTQRPTDGLLSNTTATLTPVSTGGSDQTTVPHGILARRVSIAVPLGRTGDDGCLNMPARPGDIIIVPTAGTVTLVGWVRNPGAIPITPGMTVLGAISAAGGPVFSWTADVLRTDQNGVRVVKQLKLSDIQSGAQTDLPVQAGDIIMMEKTVIGAVPYGLWEIFERSGTGVGVGMGIPP